MTEIEKQNTPTQAYLDPEYGVVALNMEGKQGPGFYAIDSETGEPFLIRPVDFNPEFDFDGCILGGELDTFIDISQTSI
ncbi:hypothetical protein [Lyticum sinuosum]|uniref:Uncharacterized protein n=1 Tax=Lyticum sinuosum TaxID=1332059 RepID=A0AAE5AH51_9RICK|nr:hypothetical protein [Lyticum sinuosum]MDZ5761582.1 hypothetical protein [Lyticum sinuosum]